MANTMTWERWVQLLSIQFGLCILLYRELTGPQVFGALCIASVVFNLCYDAVYKRNV